MPRFPRFIAPAVMLALAAVPLAAVQSGCAKKVAPLTMMPKTPLPDLKSVGLPTVWQRQLTLDAGERIKNAWRVGASVYVATSYSRIVRIDAKSGVMEWSIGLGAENFDIYRPVELPVAEGGPAKQVLIVTRGETFEIDMQTGAVLRSADLGLSVAADPLVMGNTLCVAGAGRYYGLYLDRLGGHRWLVTEPGDLFASAPVEVDASLIVASENGHLWRITGETGDWEWKDRKTNGRVTAPLNADSRAVYVPCLDQRMYAFSIDSGGELWETPLDGTLESKPRLGGSVVMVISNQRRGLYGLGRRDGKVKWNVPGVKQIATVSDSAAWVATEDGKFESVALDTGAILGAAPAEGVQIFVPNTLDQNVILVTQAGLVGMYQGKAAAATP